ncbi:hypothetical protein BaRGS_00023607 [Batillaria attramentaria]|uniref:Uncharacterized protein n=1 Tax=Batillaria attramentaria TaxID=370345 RepID=A0ABD0KE45_9CAEN
MLTPVSLPHPMSGARRVQTTVEEVAVELVATAAPRVRTAVPVMMAAVGAAAAPALYQSQPHTTICWPTTDFHCFDKTVWELTI